MPASARSASTAARSRSPSSRPKPSQVFGLGARVELEAGRGPGLLAERLGREELDGHRMVERQAPGLLHVGGEVRDLGRPLLGRGRPGGGAGAALLGRVGGVGAGEPHLGVGEDRLVDGRAGGGVVIGRADERHGRDDRGGPDGQGHGHAAEDRAPRPAGAGRPDRPPAPAGGWAKAATGPRAEAEPPPRRATHPRPQGRGPAVARGAPGAAPGRPRRRGRRGRGRHATHVTRPARPAARPRTRRRPRHPAVEQAPHQRRAHDRRRRPRPPPRRPGAGVDTPTPTSTGMSVTALSRAPSRVALRASVARSPVTPSRPTP